MKILVSLLTTLVVFSISNNAHALLTFEQKTEWNQKLAGCQKDCYVLAQQFMTVFKKNYPTAMFQLDPLAQTTLLYIHSYTLNPEVTTDHGGFWSALASSNMAVNLVAPVLTAHEEDATKEDFAKVTPEQWILDAELALNTAVALGKPVIVKGFSLGGLLASYLAAKYPNKVTKLILGSPAVMITQRADNVTCLAKTKIVHGIATLFYPAGSSQENIDYYDRFLFGSCALGDTILKIRGEFPEPMTPYSEANDAYHEQQMRQVALFARHIKVPTLMVYSESDNAVDASALETFAKNLPKAKLIVYTKDREIDHVGATYNHSNSNGGDTFGQIVKFMEE